MASVRLDQRECLPGGLPDVCAECGARATAFKENEFIWGPRWLWYLWLGGPIPVMVAALIFLRRRPITLPFCAAHRFHWGKRQGITIGILIAAAVLATLIGEGVCSLIDPSMDTAGPYIFVAVLVIIVPTLIWTWVFILNRQIKAAEIIGQNITLVNVHSAFAQALEDFRERNRQSLNLDISVETHWKNRDLEDRGREESLHRPDDLTPGDDSSRSLPMT
jgi:hypothetical protein